jgi:hypothetical protein
MLKKVLCYNRDCVDMFLNCDLKMTFCVVIFYPLVFNKNRLFLNSKFFMVFNKEYTRAILIESTLVTSYAYIQSTALKKIKILIFLS